MKVCRAAILVILPLALMGAPLAAGAQQPGVPRVGYLVITGAGMALQQGLRELGWEDGRNIVIEVRSARGRGERLPELAAELLRLNVAVIVAAGSDALAAVRKLTAAIPVVMVALADPVGSGFAASLDQPGGNVTGLTISHPEVAGKRLALLKEAIPRLSRVAALWDGASVDRAHLRETETAARALGMQLQTLRVAGPAEFDAAFEAAIKRRAEALYVSQSPMLYAHRARLAELAAKNRLPAVGILREMAEAGLLITYGPNVFDMFRHAATYVDKILKGAKPGELPIEQPARSDLSINLKTAETLGLTVPLSLLLKADDVIE
jgi:putative tryptophan/tyrosine transport system substrate-binding protein